MAESVRPPAVVSPGPREALEKAAREVVTEWEWSQANHQESPFMHAAVSHLSAALSEAKGDGTRAMFEAIAEFFADVPDAIKVMKVGEEHGEAVEAFIGMTGANPRKGVTHEAVDLVHELADVAITAFVALSSFSGTPWEALGERAAFILERCAALAVPVSPGEREPCPFCGCPGEKFDGHVCEDYEPGEREQGESESPGVARGDVAEAGERSGNFDKTPVAKTSLAFLQSRFERWAGSHGLLWFDTDAELAEAISDVLGGEIKWDPSARQGES